MAQMQTVTVPGTKIRAQVPATYSDAQVRKALAVQYKKATGFGVEQAPVVNPRPLNRPIPQSNEAYWQQRLAGQGEVRSAPQSVSSTVEAGLGSALGAIFGDSRYGAHVASRATGALNDLTPLGDVSAAEGATSAWDRGDYLQAAVLGGGAALGMIPLAGDALAKGAREISQRSFGGNRAFDKLPLQFGSVGPGGHLTEPGFAYRTIDPAEYADAEQVGQFLAKPKPRYGGEKQWVTGGNGNFFNPNGDKVVVRVPLDKFSTGRPVNFGQVETVLGAPPRRY